MTTKQSSLLVLALLASGLIVWLVLARSKPPTQNSSVAEPSQEASEEPSPFPVPDEFDDNLDAAFEELEAIDR